MTVRFHIDRIVLDGVDWSARERRSFERGLTAALRHALASDANRPAAAARRVAVESLAPGALDCGRPQHLAHALVAHALSHSATPPAAGPPKSTR